MNEHYLPRHSLPQSLLVLLDTGTRCIVCWWHIENVKGMSIPYLHVKEETKSVFWLNTQRQSKKNGSLNNKHLTRLHEVRIIWNGYAGKWDYNNQI